MSAVEYQFEFVAEIILLEHVLSLYNGISNILKANARQNTITQIKNIRIADRRLILNIGTCISDNKNAAYQTRFSTMVANCISKQRLSTHQPWRRLA